MLTIHDEHLALVKQTCEQLGCPSDCEKRGTAKLEDVIVKRCAKEDMDWAVVIQQIFAVFNDTYKKELHDLSKQRDVTYIPEPWKALGDELIYSQSVLNAGALHDYSPISPMLLMTRDLRATES